MYNAKMSPKKNDCQNEPEVCLVILVSKKESFIVKVPIVDIFGINVAKWCVLENAFIKNH